MFAEGCNKPSIFLFSYSILVDIRVITSYSAWLIIPCFVLAAGLAGLFYYRDQKNSGFPVLLTKILIGVRFLSLFVILLLLLSPVVEYIKHFQQRPLVLVLHDNSQSMVLTRDSLYYKSNQYLDNFKEKISKLPENFEIQNYAFDQDLLQNDSLHFTGYGTNFENVFRSLATRFDLARVASVVIASDGIVNEGQNPVYLLQQFNFPVHVVCLGDTVKSADISIENVDYNRVVYVGSSQTFKVHLAARQCKGKNVVLTVWEKEREVFKKSFVPVSDKEFATVDVSVAFKEEGILKYIFEIMVPGAEQNIANNRQTIAVEVIKNQQKILILANAPHPDAGVIMETLQKNQAYKVSLEFANKFNGSIKDYDLVVMVHLPSVNFPASNWFKELKENSIPCLVLLGGSTNINVFNTLQTGIKINGFKNSFDDAYPVFNNLFAQFSVSDDVAASFSDFPPLLVPYGEYDLSVAAEVFAFQRIKTVKTSRPLIVFNTSMVPFSGVICGEGLWRWRMDDRMKNLNQSKFDGLVFKMIQLIGAKERKDRLYVHVKPVLYENQPVVFDADVYNKSLEPADNAQIMLEVENSKAKKLSYSFSRQNNSYLVNAGIYPPDDYTYTATCTLGDEKFVKKGFFSVLLVNKESLNINTDHRLLKQMANISGCIQLYKENLDSLPKAISGYKNAATFSYTEKDLTDFVSIKWLFFVLLGFLSLEWFLRKYYGAV